MINNQKIQVTQKLIHDSFLNFVLKIIKEEWYMSYQRIILLYTKYSEKNLVNWQNLWQFLDDKILHTVYNKVIKQFITSKKKDVKELLYKESLNGWRKYKNYLAEEIKFVNYTKWKNELIILKLTGYIRDYSKEIHLCYVRDLGKLSIIYWIWTSSMWHIWITEEDSTLNSHLNKQLQSWELILIR